MSKHGRGPGITGERRDRMLENTRHDTYRSRSKPKNPTVCTECACVYRGGKWRWEEAPKGAYDDLCPACCRVRDRYPAGIVTLSGLPAGDNEATLNMIRNLAKVESAEHPLERLMDVKHGTDGLEVTTTGLHLARRIATALRRQYHDRISIQYGEDENLIRVQWQG